MDEKTVISSDVSAGSPSPHEAVGSSSSLMTNTMMTNTSPRNRHRWIIRIEKYFKLRERGSTWTTEFRAGVVTFVTMAYILAVNASILSLTGGTCNLDNVFADEGTPEATEFAECLEIIKLDLITATAASSCIACLIMGLGANLPIALAPGMGINAYFVFNVVGTMWEPTKINYSTALLAVFIEGWIFLILSITGTRTYIAKIIPSHLKSAITGGIGMFLALIGLQSDNGIGLVVSDGATNVTLGGCGHQYLDCDSFGLECGCYDGKMEGATTWMGIIGFLLIIILMVRNVKGAVMISILFVAVLSWFRNTEITYFPDTELGNARWATFKQVASFHAIEKTGFAAFKNVDLSDAGDIFVALMTFLYVDLLDTTGTLYSMAEFGGYLDENGDFERSKWAFSTDAIGTIIGSLLGTSPVTSFIESGSGIQEGGRTGITAVVIACLYFISLFFSPILASIPPWATGPALIVIGALMFRSVLKINWENLREAAPAFITLIIMPFTYSIAYGIIAGLGVHFFIVLMDFIFDQMYKRFGICSCGQNQIDDDMDNDKKNKKVVMTKIKQNDDDGDVSPKTTNPDDEEEQP